MTQIELTDLTNGSITNQEWQGTGVFDKLMSAVNKNIEVQYQKGRITGSDYAQVYTQSLQATLQQAVEFLLRKDLTEAQIEIARQQAISAYVERIGKDKEVAKMGLDNVMKNAEAERLTNGTMVYTPQYKEVV
jgi:hypothetical protein